MAERAYLIKLVSFRRIKWVTNRRSQLIIHMSNPPVRETLVLSETHGHLHILTCCSLHISNQV
jgi:hypothetical protein